MTYSFENLSQTQTLEKLFEQYKKEMRYLRNFSELDSYENGRQVLYFQRWRRGYAS
jgi:hypothetical protein